MWLNENVKNIVIPESVVEIEGSAFDGTNITNLKLPSNIKKIGGRAFANTKNLLKVTIPKTIEEASNIFEDSALEEITFEEGLEIIPQHICRNAKNLKKINLSSTLKKISFNAFSYINVDEFIIPDGVTKVEAATFDYATVKRLVIPASVTEFGYQHFTDQDSMILVVAKDSTAEEYAKHYKIKYEYLNSENPTEPEKQIININTCNVSGNKDKTYTGKSIKQSIKVTINGKTLVENTDYTVSYKDNKKVGIATITITGKGNYEGTQKITFYIIPKGTSISKLKSARKKFIASWKKQTTETTGYEIQYSTNKNFTSETRKVSISKNKTTSKAISKLKAKKKYYVRIRTYKKVNGKKVYSSWSSSKSVKTKK